jgi:hypothetical protein
MEGPCDQMLDTVSRPACPPVGELREGGGRLSKVALTYRQPNGTNKARSRYFITSNGKLAPSHGGGRCHEECKASDLPTRSV